MVVCINYDIFACNWPSWLFRSERRKLLLLKNASMPAQEVFSNGFTSCSLYSSVHVQKKNVFVVNGFLAWFFMFTEEKKHCKNWLIILLLFLVLLVSMMWYKLFVLLTIHFISIGALLDYFRWVWIGCSLFTHYSEYVWDY